MNKNIELCGKCDIISREVIYIMLTEAEVVAKISNLVDSNSNRIIASITEKIKDLAEKSKIDLRTAFVDYLNKSYQKNSLIKTILYKNQPKHLYDFFECNDVVLDDNSIDCSNVNNILEISHFNLIVGYGGMGKSTLMKHFFIDALIRNQLIPIFIELRGFTEGDNLLDYCYREISNLGFSSEKKYFEYALKSGCFLLILDGFDEIQDPCKKNFRQSLFSFVDQYCDNYYLVSSRPCEQFIGWSRFTKFDTIPFSKEKAINLISKIDYDATTKERFLTKLKDELYDRHKSFASNPLLLNIMLLTFDNYSEIPDKLHIFYYQAFDTMYSIHDATKPDGFKRDLKSCLPSDEFKRVFATFCFRSYIKGKIEFTKEEILELLTEAGKTIDNFVAEDYLEDLKSAVCLVYIDGLNYRFIHRSFQEYFTALYLKNLDDDLQNKVCKLMIDKQTLSFQYDSVFSMLRDMSRERFEKNVVLPFLNDIERYINSGDRNKSLYCYLVYAIVIHKDLRGPLPFDYDWVFSERNVLITVDFNPKVNVDFVFFLFQKYCQREQSSLNLEKLFNKYLNVVITKEIINKDSALLSKILTETTIGNMIRTFAGLRRKLAEQQRNAVSEIEALFEE